MKITNRKHGLSCFGDISVQIGNTDGVVTKTELTGTRDLGTLLKAAPCTESLSIFL